MSTFRAGGLMSGLDTNTIIEQLVRLERIPIQKMEKRQELLSSQRSMFTEIESSLKALQSKMKDFDSKEKILSYNAKSSDEDFMTVEASGEAVAGSHSVQILQTARAEQNRSAAFGNNTDEVTEGTLTITLQGEDPVVVDIEAGYNLDDVAYAINRSGLDVSAAVINTGTEYYLTIYNQETGFEVGSSADDAVTIVENYTGGSGAQLTLSQTVQAQNAQISFDGLSVERRDNAITDVVPGLSLQIGDDTGQPTIEISVEPDTEGVQANLKSFVDAFNKVMSKVSAQFKVGADESTGILFGDGTLRSLMMQLQTVVTESANNSSGGFSMLRDIGIKVSSDGTISINDSDLKDAMDDNFRGISTIFTTETTGMVDRMDSLIEGYTDSIDGVFKQRKDGFDERYDNLSDQIDKMEMRIEAYEKRLVTQFTSMELVIAQLQSQQSYLASALSQGG
jgi:flagellar hook-associated protein 2